jgi:hypothetical protein
VNGLRAVYDANLNRDVTGRVGDGRDVRPTGRSAGALALILVLCLAGGARSAPLMHGVIFFCPPHADAAVAELQKIRADGYNLIEFASWPWTLPTPRNQLEATATAVLAWCDVHEMRFFLMHNIQYGGLDGIYENPMGAAPWLSDWIRVLKGHKCVAGVILGNEVGPAAGEPQKSPKWWAGFIADLKSRHATIAALNAAWETKFTDFDAVVPPKPGSPGAVDYNRFAVKIFDRFYGTLFRQVCEPALGKLLYGPKTGGDPLLQRACTSFSMICWDDMLSDYPQWRVKAMGDVARMTGKPVFNSELHLYHEGYAFFGSPAKSHYRYFLSALDGEWMSASFAWGQWGKAETQKIHRATPGILAELRRLEPQLRAFGAATPDIHVLLSQPLADDDTPMQRLYTEIANLGFGWEFVCPQDISRIAAGAVYVPGGTRLSLEACRALANLPASVRLVLADGKTPADEYGHALPAGLRDTIVRRVCREHGAKHLPAGERKAMAPPYAEPVEISYASWSPERGHFGYPVSYPRLEARRVPYENGWLVAVINHATGGEPVKTRLPWPTEGASKVRDLTAGGKEVNPDALQTFAPLDVRVYQYEGKR